MIRQLSIFLFAVFVSSISAQDSLQIVSTHGNSPVVNLSSITKITFTNTSIILGGTNRTYQFSDIRKIVFKDASPVAVRSPELRPFRQIQSGFARSQVRS